MVSNSMTVIGRYLEISDEVYCETSLFELYCHLKHFMTAEMPTIDFQVLVDYKFESCVSPTPDVHTPEPPTPPPSVISSQRSF